MSELIKEQDRQKVNHLQNGLLAANLKIKDLEVALEIQHELMREKNKEIEKLNKAFDDVNEQNTYHANRMVELQKERDELRGRLEHAEDISKELEQNLFAAQDQNHYYKLLCEFRDKNVELQNKIEELKCRLRC